MADIEAIKARAAAASSGPWFWRGNVEFNDPSLCHYKPGYGRVEIMWHHKRERTADDPEAKQYREFLADAKYWDQALNNGLGAFRSYTDAELDECVHEDYLTDPWGGPQTDSRLCFTDHERLVAMDARDLPVFEVAPTATTRDDPRVYRADIIGIRHPDAEFIAHARQDVDDLLAEIDCLRAELEAARG